MNKIWVLLLMMLVVVSGVYASGVTTDRLNFYDSEQHTINISNTEGGVVNAVSTMPTGFSFVSSVDGCTNPSGQTINCNSIADEDSATFIISSPVSGNEYELYDLTTTVNGTSVNNVSFINIREDEIFNTLVEYGRGRGNYFYNSMGTATSAGTGTGYEYVPEGTPFELNYLHKVFNIKQYFGLASSQATDVEFSCVYPYHTVVRSHLVESMSDDSNDWTVDYSLPRIDGSWERMGFLGMDFDDGEYDVADTFSINCTNLQYTLEDAYGNIVVGEDSFSLEVRSPDPINVTVSSGTATIGNGTSEVEITYTVTNNEVYPMDKAVIEIEAPENAQFIGVRGELWGSAQDRYRYELTTMEAGQVENIVLVARFDTSASSDTTLLLSEGVKVQFVPTWELNAYNPMTYIQEIAVTETQAVNYAVSSEITGLQNQIDRIETNTVNINNTVNTLNAILEEINSTTHTTSDNLLSINTTIMDEIASVNLSLSTQMTTGFNTVNSNINNLSTQVTNFESTVQQLVNCTLNAGSPICARLDLLNTSINSLSSDLLSINTSLTTQISNVNSSIITQMNSQFDDVDVQFNDTYNLINAINTSINANIDAVNSSLSADLVTITNTVNDIETDVDNLHTDLLSINQSLVSQMNSNTTTILNAIEDGFADFDGQTDIIMEELAYMQGFNEELIFLVTDSVGLANDGKADLSNGNVDSAVEKLQQAEAKLLEASEIMNDEKKPIENDMKIASASNVFSKMVYVVKGWFI